MKFTNEQKIKVLKEAKRLIKTGGERCICLAIITAGNFRKQWDLKNEINGTDASEFVCKLFPELQKYKPEIPFCNKLWWDASEMKPRITVLNNYIKELGGKL